MIYLASPYSHPKEDERQLRFLIVENHVAWALRTGKNVFSPIVYCHAIAGKHRLPTDARFWARFNMDMLSICDELQVLNMEGWQDSIGILEELRAWYCLGNKRVYVAEYETPSYEMFRTAELIQMMEMRRVGTLTDDASIRRLHDSSILGRDAIRGDGGKEEV